jgi:hypothetical protein
MATISDAINAVQGRLKASITDVPLRFQNENGPPLPDAASAFVFVAIEREPKSTYLAGFGAGRGANLWRNPAYIVAYAFVPKNQGLKPATDLAERVGAVFRSYRDDTISCFESSIEPGGDGASMRPPGLASEVGNYFWSLSQTTFFFDQIG